MYDAAAEAMSTDERHAVQGHRLRELIDRLLTAGGVQAQRLRDAGVDAGAAVGLRDLASLPTTSKRDLWDAYPLGLLAVPREQEQRRVADQRSHQRSVQSEILIMARVSPAP